MKIDFFMGWPTHLLPGDSMTLCGAVCACGNKIHIFPFHNEKTLSFECLSCEWAEAKTIDYGVPMVLELDNAYPEGYSINDI